MNTNQRALLKVSEVAEELGLAVGTVYHLISQGRIPVTRLSRRCVRVRRSDLDRWLDELTEPGRDGSGPRRFK